MSRTTILGTAWHSSSEETEISIEKCLNNVVIYSSPEDDAKTVDLYLCGLKEGPRPSRNQSSFIPATMTAARGFWSRLHCHFPFDDPMYRTMTTPSIDQISREKEAVTHPSLSSGTAGGSTSTVLFHIGWCKDLDWTSSSYETYPAVFFQCSMSHVNLVRNQ